MDDRELAALLPGELSRRWGLATTSVTPLGGGMNSATALVESAQGIFVAKGVPHSAGPALVAGAELAERLEAVGIRCGAAFPACDGALTVSIAEGVVMVMRFVVGRELTAEAADQPVLARTLARAHAGLGTARRRAPFFDWLGSGPRLAEVGGWIEPSIRAVVQEYDGLPALTWGTLHTDPAPEAFRLDDTTAEVGMIDWAGGCEGPLLYDVASALMYLGGLEPGRPFLESYTALGPVQVEEIDVCLPTFRRFRAVVQADYFAGRILAEDLTGIDDPVENRKGLDDAYGMLVELGGLRNLD